MTDPDWVGRAHGRLTQHIADLDRIRAEIVATRQELSGETAGDWTFGQLSELWTALRGYRWPRRLLRELAGRPDTWVAFTDLVPEGERAQARNEIAAMTRTVRKQRGPATALFERDQRPETNYKMAYRMPAGLAEMIKSFPEEDA